MRSRSGARRPRIVFGVAAASLAALAAAAMLAPTPTVRRLGCVIAIGAVALAVTAVVRAERLPAPMTVLGLAGLLGWVVMASMALSTAGRLNSWALRERSISAAPALTPATDTDPDDLVRSVGALPSGRHVVLRVDSNAESANVATRRLTDGDGVRVLSTEYVPYAETRPLDLRGRGRDEVAVAGRAVDATASTTVRCAISVDGRVVVEQEAHGPRAAVLCTATD